MLIPDPRPQTPALLKEETTQTFDTLHFPHNPLKRTKNYPYKQTFDAS